MKRALPKRNASHSNPFLLALVALTSIIVIIITAHFYEHSRLADSTHKLRHIKPALGRHFWAASHWRRQYFSRPRQWHPIKNRLGGLCLYCATALTIYVQYYTSKYSTWLYTVANILGMGMCAYSNPTLQTYNAVACLLAVQIMAIVRNQQRASIQIWVHGLNGSTYLITMNANTAGHVLLEYISAAEHIPKQHLRLLFEGRRIQSTRSMQYYNIQHGSRICVTSLLRGGMAPKSTDLAYAVTDYFAEGSSFRGQNWLAHLSRPPDGRLHRASLYVIPTRFSSLDDFHLLCPLWPHGDDAEKDRVLQKLLRLAQPVPDLKAEWQRLLDLAELTRLQLQDLHQLLS